MSGHFSSGAAWLDKTLQSKTVPADKARPPVATAAPAVVKSELTQSGHRPKFVLSKPAPPPPLPVVAAAPPPLSKGQVVTKSTATAKAKPKPKRKPRKPKPEKEESSDDDENEGDLSFVEKDNSEDNPFKIVPTYYVSEKKKHSTPAASSSKYDDDDDDSDDPDDEEGYNSDPDRFKGVTFEYKKKELVTIPLEYVDPSDIEEVSLDGEKVRRQKLYVDPNDKSFDADDSDDDPMEVVPDEKNEKEEEGEASSDDEEEAEEKLGLDDDDEEEEEKLDDAKRKAKLRAEIESLKPDQTTMFIMDAHKPRHVRTTRVSQKSFEHARTYVPRELVDVVKVKGIDDESSSSSSVLNPEVDEDADTTDGRGGGEDEDDEDAADARKAFAKNVTMTMRKQFLQAQPEGTDEINVTYPAEIFKTVDKHVDAIFSFSHILFNAMVEQQTAKNLQSDFNQGLALCVGNSASHKQTEVAQEYLSLQSDMSETVAILALVSEANSVPV